MRRTPISPACRTGTGRSAVIVWQSAGGPISRVARRRADQGHHGREFSGDPERGGPAGLVEHINSYARRSYDQGGDGSYEDTYGHFPLHANGMVIGAPLGGRQPYPVRLYEDFDTPDKVAGWPRRARLEQSMARIPPLLGRPALPALSRACTSAWRARSSPGSTTDEDSAGGAGAFRTRGTSRWAAASTSCRCTSITGGHSPIRSA